MYYNWFCNWYILIASHSRRIDILITWETVLSQIVCLKKLSFMFLYCIHKKRKISADLGMLAKTQWRNVFFSKSLIAVHCILAHQRRGLLGLLDLV